MVVSDGDPIVAREQDALRIAPFVLGGRHPARLPEVQVEMDQGQARLRGKRARKGALAGAGQPGDHYPATNGIGTPWPDRRSRAREGSGQSVRLVEANPLLYHEFAHGRILALWRVVHWPAWQCAEWTTQAL